MNNAKEIIVNNEIAYQYVYNKNYYITKGGDLYSIYVKGAHGRTDIDNPHKVAYGQDKDGYYRVILSNNGDKKYIKIHQIVVNQFLGGCPDGYVINHIDGNKHNNAVYNLEVVTNLENIQHAWKTGLNRKELNYLRIPVDVVDNHTNITYHFNSLAETHNKINDLSLRYIRNVKNNIVNFNMCLFKKVKTGDAITDYFVECYYNGMLYKTFKNNEAVGNEFDRAKNTVSQAHKSIYVNKVNRYTITFPNVSTIESTND